VTDKPKRSITPAQRAALLDNLSMAHEAQRTRPRCGAQRRSADGTCRNLALANGRCRLHGGRTPKGTDWHKVQLANPGRSIERLVEKEAEVEARRARQEARRAAMSPEERAAHDAWHRARRPGSPGERQKARDARAAKEWLQETLGRAMSASPPPGEASALSEAIRALEEAQRALGAASGHGALVQDHSDEGDMFG
jgi:hypothetical protein